MHYAHNSFLVTINKVEEEGILETIHGSIPVQVGDVTLVDEHGNTEVVTEEYFNENFTPVRKVKKQRTKSLSPFEEEMMKGYLEMGSLIKQSNDNEENYIFEPNKAL